MANKRILVVEDEPDISFIITRTLSMIEDLEVVACSSGVVALQREDFTDFDLYLLDFMMPEMDGLTLFTRLKELKGSMPRVAFLTARVMDVDRERMLAAGALDVLVKPFEPRLLANRIGELLV